MDGLKQLQTMNLVHGLDLKKLNHLPLCTNCFQGKQHKNKFPKQRSTRMKELLKLVHANLCGPFTSNLISIGGLSKEL
jgi:hypothetical protein